MVNTLDEFCHLIWSIVKLTPSYHARSVYERSQLIDQNCPQILIIRQSEWMVRKDGGNWVVGPQNRPDWSVKEAISVDTYPS